MIPYTKEAHKLFHDGVLAFSRLEENGIRVDVAYLNRTIRKIDAKITRLEESLKKSEVSKAWEKIFGRRTNFDSRSQLGVVLFDVMGFDPPELTRTGKYKVDEKSLGHIDHPFIKRYLRIKKLQLISGNFLANIQREVVDGFIHPFFDLHKARSFRSSSSGPNFQNQPIRDPVLGRLVRRCIIAREGHHLVEHDISGAEVLTAACYHLDPNMIHYLEDKTSDMHRDMAMVCFLLTLDEMTPVNDLDAKRIKLIRYVAKSFFVFAQFYGSFFIDCAKSLWGAIGELGLKLRDGTSLYDHLASKGITSLGVPHDQSEIFDKRWRPSPGTFAAHIKEVEYWFWSERFPTYNSWRKKWVEQYRRQGWMLTLTGFVCQGPMERNKILSYPIQGSSFHCLLKVLIWLVKEELKKHKMKTLIIGQIHDSLVGDVPSNELCDYVGLVQELFRYRLKSVWPWLILPMMVEAEACPIGGSWADKEKVDIG